MAAVIEVVVVVVVIMMMINKKGHYFTPSGQCSTDFSALVIKQSLHDRGMQI